MRQVLLAVTVLIGSTPAAAQVFEVGAGIGRGCIGDSSGFCGNETGPMLATHASAWMADRFEIGLRLARLPRKSFGYTVPRDSRFDRVDDPAIRQMSRIAVGVRDRSRRIFAGEAIYHFARGRPVRALLGLGLGEVINHFDHSCAPAGCERLMPIVASPVGKGSIVTGNLTIIAGVSGRIRERLQVRGGVRLHNFAGEGASTTEVFIATGYRFGRD